MKIKFGDLIELSPAPDFRSVFGVGVEENGLSLHVIALPEIQKQSREIQWVIPRAACGNSPKQYHLEFLMALLSSRVTQAENCPEYDCLQWVFPAIDFQTDNATRLSMTLNGMRMSTEYFEHGSERVLQLVEQRLAAGQRDVIHDILVYLMQRILELRAEQREEHLLQADALAAYLGLDAQRVGELLFWPMQSAALTQQIEAGQAGTPRRLVDISSLVENQMTRFSCAMEKLQIREAGVLRLIDEIVARFYKFTQSDC